MMKDKSFIRAMMNKMWAVKLEPNSSNIMETLCFLLEPQILKQAKIYLKTQHIICIITLYGTVAMSAPSFAASVT